VLNVIVEEMLLRFIGRNSAGINVSKQSGVEEAGVDVTQLCRAAYSILTGLWFGKSVVMSNACKFWEESLNRLVSIMIARRDDKALAKNNALVLQAVELFHKLFADCGNVELTANTECSSTKVIITIEQFEQNVTLLIKLSHRCATDERALHKLLTPIRETFTANPNELTLCDVYQPLNSNQSFTKHDSELLFETYAKLHREFVSELDLRMLYSMWVAISAFFAHMIRLRKNRASTSRWLASLTLFVIMIAFSAFGCLIAS
jgi:hypothetical protein